MKQCLFLLLACTCTAPRQDTGENEPEHSTILIGGPPPTSGCYVIYFDKRTNEMSLELRAIEEEGTNFCLTDEYHD